MRTSIPQNGRIWCAAILVALLVGSCGAQDAQQPPSGDKPGAPATDPTPTAAAEKANPAEARILFLHHSTGQNVWNGGVAEWFRAYNAAHSARYDITERAFPKDAPYGWENYPYDYWNIWVRHAGRQPFKEEPTLELLTDKYDLIVFKHCFPVSNIEPDTGQPDVASADKRIENYRLQYAALRKKLREFPKVRFIVWTGAAQVPNDADEASATRARDFFKWVRTEWDEKGDNIFVWDFHTIETEGGLYVKPAYASGDAHPNEVLSRKAAPLFCQRVVDVIQGRGDTGNILGGDPAAPPSPGPAVAEAPSGEAAPPVDHQPAPTPSPTPAVQPTPAVKPQAGEAGSWVFDNAEDADARKRLWSDAAEYINHEGANVVALRFAKGAEEDWGEYGKQRIVETRPPERNIDISAYRYMALHVRTDREMELVLQLVTRPDPKGPPAQSHFAFTAYLQPPAGAWKTFAIDLSKLELAAEGDDAYAAAGKPTRPMHLSVMRFITNAKNQAAAVMLDDVTFYRDLPEDLRGSLQQP